MCVYQLCGNESFIINLESEGNFKIGFQILASLETIIILINILESYNYVGKGNTQKH